ncbi:YybH family protein [Marinobacter bohaiensis]|uniref:YybH family protein n=1 Tax=Marinobacter bohaiensis TaxID=2201898 RepID=UPI000DADD444|nr:nuclear transport factor 2 family protein [Marinobacter bohaiensis]
MTTRHNDAAAEDAIRTQLSQWQEAVVSGDVARIMMFYAEDLVAYDAVVALRFKGREAYRKHWQYCMTLCSGPFEFKLHEIDVSVADDLAFAFFLVHCGGTNEQGEMQTGWMRGTSCLRQEAGEWKVVHEHFSAPFDPQTMAIIQDAQP